MKSRQALFLAGGLLAAAIVYALALYPQLPDSIPIHWNLRGQVDGWAEKRLAVWLMPSVMLALIGMQVTLPLRSPDNFSVTSFRKTFDYLMVMCTALMSYIHVIMLQAALHPTLEFGRSLLVGLFLFLALMGNVLGRTRRNLWIGIRTPWTLANDAVWDATHRLGGYLLTGAGITGAIAIWCGAPVMASMTLLMAALLIPAGYSFILYKRTGGSNA